MATPFQQQVTQAQNTKRSAEGARAEAQQARAGIPTPTADRLIAQGDQQLTAGNDLLARGHPVEATGQYAAANASFNQATADAERERAALARQAAAAAAARQAAAAAAQQAAIALQRQQAAAEQAAARSAAQKAAAAAAVQAALNAKAAAVAANTQALHTIATQPPPPTSQPAPIGKPTPEPTSPRPSPQPAPPARPQPAAGGKRPQPPTPPKHKPAKPSRPPAPKPPTAVFASSDSSLQLSEQDIMFREWQKTGASRTVLRCLFLIGVAENEWDPYTCNTSNHCGVFQLDSGWQAMHSYQDTAYWAAYAMKNGFYSHGGLVHIAAANPGWSIGEMVQACQGAGPTWQAATDYYNGRLAEADAALAATERRLGAGAGRGHVPSHGPGSGPQIMSPPAPVHSGAWNGNPEGQQLQAAYQNYHDTLSKWNPGFRHQLQLLAHRPIGG